MPNSSLKHCISALLLLCLLLAACSGCGSAPAAEDGAPSVVCTIFPLYDWTRNIIGDAGGVRLSLLLENGVDMHSYQPSANDIVTISSCDLLIYVGGESDEWVDDVLAEAMNPGMKTLNLLEVLGDAVKQEEALEGMQGGEEADEPDEHVWLSLRNAARCCRAICGALSGLDANNAARYAEQTEAYCAELETLDSAYAAVAESGRRRVLLFADRYPFRYLADDYALKSYAAFSGCEAETEASFETVAFLAGRVSALSLPVILTTESPVPRLAETVAGSAGKAGVRILALDSLQSATRSDISAGLSYLGAMEQNLAVLETALN